MNNDYDNNIDIVRVLLTHVREQLTAMSTPIVTLLDLHVSRCNEPRCFPFPTCVDKEGFWHQMRIYCLQQLHKTESVTANIRTKSRFVSSTPKHLQPPLPQLQSHSWPRHWQQLVYPQVQQQKLERGNNRIGILPYFAGGPQAASHAATHRNPQAKKRTDFRTIHITSCRPRNTSKTSIGMALF